jgi:hypothetical protein
LRRSSASRLQPLIEPRPGSAAGADIAPTYYSGNRTELRAVGIGDPSGNEMRDRKPRGRDRGHAITGTGKLRTAHASASKMTPTTARATRCTGDRCDPKKYRAERYSHSRDDI